MQSSLKPIPLPSAQDDPWPSAPEPGLRGPRTNLIWRWLYTLRYHRPSQLLRRLQKRTAGRLAQRQPPPPASPASPDSRCADAFRQLHRQRQGTRRAPSDETEILAGRWQFLGTTCDLGSPLRWSEVANLDVDHLWKFQAHYHEWLLDLGPATDAGWELVRSWAEAFPSPLADPSGDAWHPFCISRRIPAWCMAWHAHPPASTEVQATLLESISQQCGYLATHLELDLGGNHLLENLRALVLGSAFVSSESASAWRGIAAAHLYRELPRQILASGEHFERTPMYHNIVLELLLDMVEVLRAPGTSAADRALADFVDGYAQRMADFLGDLLHPDGEIPLLGDSALSQTPRSVGLLERAGHRRPARMTGATVRGNYWSWCGSEGEHLLLDAGDAVANDLPAHGHCDLLGIEASLFGRRFLVDGGVYDYGDTAMRAYCRGSRAHNVLTVDELDQCDVWSRFRMGYRGTSDGLETGDSAGFSWARAAHNAYRRVGVSRVSRWIGCRPGVWVGLDWATGAAGHRISGRLRIHPDFERLGQPELGHFVFSAAGQEVHLWWLWGDIAEERGWYCPDFGVRYPAHVLRWSADCEPYCSAWAISTQPLKPEVDVQLRGKRATVTYIPTNESIVVSL